MNLVPVVILGHFRKSGIQLIVPMVADGQRLERLSKRCCTILAALHLLLGVSGHIQLDVIAFTNGPSHLLDSLKASKVETLTECLPSCAI